MWCASDRSNRSPSVIADCAEQRERSAQKVMHRAPISKQRSKHIQAWVLVEAAKLAPRYSHELALIYEKEMQRGNRNRATLAVARKMVAWMVAVERRKQRTYFVHYAPRNAEARWQRLENLHE